MSSINNELSVLAEMQIEAIILAGGMGTRLRSVITNAPKPMAEVLNRPFLEHLIDYWIDQGVEKFTISLGYLGQCISNHFGNEYRGKSIEYVTEPEPLGTGGALKYAISMKRLVKSEILVMNGDTWFEINLSSFRQDYNLANTPILVALKQVKENDRYGAVRVDSQRKITEFGVKNRGKCFINGGCYLLNTSWLKEQFRKMPYKFSFEQDFLALMAPDGVVSASLQKVQFLDIGVPEDYRLACEFISKMRSE